MPLCATATNVPFPYAMPRYELASDAVGEDTTIPVVVSAIAPDAAPIAAPVKTRLNTAPRSSEREKGDFMSVLWLGVK